MEKDKNGDAKGWREERADRRRGKGGRVGGGGRDDVVILQTDRYSISRIVVDLPYSSHCTYITVYT